MKTFLGEVAADLYARYGESLADRAMLFPSRRARLFFAVMIPKDDPDKYLDVLSEISELLKDREVKQKLLSLETPLEFCQFIGSWTPPVPEPQAASEEDYPKEDDTPQA